jgi:shikimate kinase
MTTPQTYRRIVLIGFRACGKSNIARRIAEHVGWKLYSLDAMLEEEFGEPIALYVQKYGWQAFRQAELGVAESLHNTMKCVLDCGGGIVEQPQSVEPLIEHSFVVHVTADIETIIQRLERKQNRPLLSGATIRDDVVSNFTRRQPLYEQYAHATIDTTHASKDDSAKQVLAILRTLDLSLPSL